MLGEHAPVESEALMLMITERLKPFVTPVVGAQGRMLSFKQFDNGTVLIGGGHQGRAEPDSNRTHLDFRELATSATTAAILFPRLRGVQLVRCWGGIEGQLPDGGYRRAAAGRHSGHRRQRRGRCLPRIWILWPRLRSWPNCGADNRRPHRSWRI
jgi:glycine/D-amino acid oxidase-like deaminating enzyme